MTEDPSNDDAVFMNRAEEIEIEASAILDHALEVTQSFEKAYTLLLEVKRKYPEEVSQDDLDELNEALLRHVAWMNSYGIVPED